MVTSLSRRRVQLLLDAFPGAELSSHNAVARYELSVREGPPKGLAVGWGYGDTEEEAYASLARSLEHTIEARLRVNQGRFQAIAEESRKLAEEGNRLFGALRRARGRKPDADETELLGELPG